MPVGDLTKICSQSIHMNHISHTQILIYIILTICLLIGYEPTANFGNQ